MSKTIFLTPKTTRWIFLLNGLFNTLLGVHHLIRYAESLGGLLLGIVWTTAGILMSIYGIMLFNSAHKLIPKVHVDENGIYIREDAHREQKNIVWKDVKEITFKPFEIDFHMKGKIVKTAVLHTNAEISLTIKRTIREYAEERNIEVKGG